MKSTSRRSLLKSAAALALAPAIIPATAIGAADGTPAPSNRLTMGFIGVGKQGMFHLAAISRRKDVTVLGVCDCQDFKREKAKDTINKGSVAAPPKVDQNSSINASDPASAISTTAGEGAGTKPADVKYYTQFRELLERPEIDTVLIATPDHWHAVMAVEALRAGKDVYLEKPLSLTIKEAREICKAVKRFDRVLQVGSQQRSAKEFRLAAEWVRSGRLGEIKTINVNIGGPAIECDLPAEPVRPGCDWDAWLGPAPWRPFNKVLCPGPEFDGFPNWRNYRDYSGGMITDWGAHHFDIAQWALGMDDTGPTEIIPAGGERKHLTIKYANGIEMYHGGGPDGITFHGTKGKLFCNRGQLATDPITIAKLPTLPSEQRLYLSPGHHEDFFRCVRERREPICTAEIGARTVTVCHLVNICYWLKRPLKWDPAKEEFVGDAEANRWLDRPKRAPWFV